MPQNIKQYIVIAEDDKAYARVYANKLESEGYEVTLIGRGDQVVAALKQRRPDLLVLDLIMPGLDGFGVLQELRATEGLQDLRVIVASNLSQDVDKEKIAKYSVFDFFIKSDISITEMIQRIKNALQTP